MLAHFLTSVFQTKLSFCVPGELKGKCLGTYNTSCCLCVSGISSSEDDWRLVSSESFCLALVISSDSKSYDSLACKTLILIQDRASAAGLFVP